MITAKSNLNKICEQIGPNEIGIIWLANDELHEKKPYFFELNYLLDGILSQSNLSSGNQFHFFLTQQFTNQFFLIYKNCKDHFQIDELYKVIENSPQFMQKDSKILIMSEANEVNSKNLVEKLSKKFKQMQFGELLV